MKNNFIEVGVVKKIFRYPVKGLRGNSLDKVFLGWYGFEGDRQYAITSPSDISSGRPWMTGRLVPEIISYQANYENGKFDKSAKVLITTPKGKTLSLDSEELKNEFAELFGIDVQILKLSTGCFDSLTISLISDKTLLSIGENIGMPLNPRRFRPNVYIEMTHPDFSSEDEWLGKGLRFGTRDTVAKIRLLKENVRCVMINIDPETQEKSPVILKAVTNNRKSKAGVYGSTEQTGEIRVGDSIYLSEK